jgi:hypothetical protein
MLVASLTLLTIFTTIASVDGFYFHIYRYRLYARPESRYEHVLHTWNAVLFPLTIAPVFLAETTGAALWSAVFFNVLTLGIEAADVLCERASRASLGGLTPAEYLMHFGMSGLRWGYVVLALAAKPAEAWSAPSSWTWLVPSPAHLAVFVPWCVAVVGVPVAVLHVLLARDGAPRDRLESLLRLRLSSP